MLEAHYSTETKVKRPSATAAEAPATLPSQHIFSDKEATQKMTGINNDIFVGTQKEKKKNEFNKSLYLKIFGAVGLTVAGIAGYDKIKKFFKKS